MELAHETSTGYNQRYLRNPGMDVYVRSKDCSVDVIYGTEGQEKWIEENSWER
jgi:hypothetical protein